MLLSIINTCPPSREHIPRHSTQVPASFLLRSSTTSISSNSISTPVYSSFFFSCLTPISPRVSGLLFLFPSSSFYSLPHLPLPSPVMTLWTSHRFRFLPFAYFASLHSLLHSLVAIVADYPSRSLRWIIGSKNQETPGGGKPKRVSRKKRWNEVRR